jgi:hypothetical protein
MLSGRVTRHADGRRVYWHKAPCFVFMLIPKHNQSVAPIFAYYVLHTSRDVAKDLIPVRKFRAIRIDDYSSQVVFRDQRPSCHKLWKHLQEFVATRKVSIRGNEYLEAAHTGFSAAAWTLTRTSPSASRFGTG